MKFLRLFEERDNMKKKKNTSCDTCLYYSYDDEYECYTCLMELDEDEMYSFVLGNFNNCPYYKFGDEYTIVKKQI